MAKTMRSLSISVTNHNYSTVVARSKLFSIISQISVFMVLITNISSYSSYVLNIVVRFVLFLIFVFFHCASTLLCHQYVFHTILYEHNTNNNIITISNNPLVVITKSIALLNNMKAHIAKHYSRNISSASNINMTVLIFVK